MPSARPLADRTIGISISESPDLSELGLSKLRLRDAMVEVARHLLVAGAHLVYGGDLRANGFTELLFELVARYWIPDSSDAMPPVTNYLPWPVHVGIAPPALEKRRSELKDVATLILLG